MSNLGLSRACGLKKLRKQLKVSIAFGVSLMNCTKLNPPPVLIFGFRLSETVKKNKSLNAGVIKFTSFNKQMPLNRTTSNNAEPPFLHTIIMQIKQCIK